MHGGQTGAFDGEESGQHIVAHECMMETTQVERHAHTGRPAVGGGIRHLQQC